MISAIRNAANLPQFLVAPADYLKIQKENGSGPGAALGGIAALYLIVHAVELAAMWQKAHMLGSVPLVQWLAAAVPAVVVLLKVVSISGILYLGLRLVGLESGFRSIIVMVSALQTINLLHEVVQTAYRGYLKNVALGDVGANLLAAHAPILVQNLLSIVNPFSIWYGAVLFGWVFRTTTGSVSSKVLAILPYVLAVICLHAVVSYSFALHFTRL